MRRLKDDQSGTILILSALLLVVLLGMAAFVVDLGGVMVERRNLQNGADAAALAIALECSRGDCGNHEDTADDFADDNHRTTAHVVEVVGPDGNAPTPAGGQVTVRTGTGDRAGPGLLPQFFSGVLGQEEGLSTGALATAAWGATAAGRTIPVTFSTCEWDLFTGGLGEEALPTGTVLIELKEKGKASTCDGPAGKDFPGGFGWLDLSDDPADANQCIARVELGKVGGDVGNNPPGPGNGPCDRNHFLGLLGQLVLIPIHDEAELAGQQGSKAEYTIVGFGGFRISDFKLTSGNNMKSRSNFSCPGPGNQGVCIAGRFEAYFDADTTPAPGAESFGAITVALIE
jgi:Flp pilus assembly protein TadG